MDRRHWLRSISLTGSMALVGGFPLLATPVSRQKESFPKYAPGDLIKLSSNENPYGPSPRVREAIIRAFDHACRYPYPYADALREKLAAIEGVTPDCITITGGSTEGLKICGAVFTEGGKEVLAAQPTFLAMMQYAREWGGSVQYIPVGKDKGYDLNALEKAIGKNTGLIFLCNPNNPTGTLLPADTLESFCRRASEKTVVFSDEAYYDYIETPHYPSMVKLVREGKDVIVSRTFSKVYGLAGLRIGYLVARPELMEKIEPKLVAYSNVLAIEAATVAMEDKEFYNQSLEMNRQCKEMIYKTLQQLDLDYIPSHTNFVFFHSGKPLRELHRQMLEKGIQIGRPFPPFTDWCRISTGTHQEVEIFTKALTEIYS